MRRFPGLLIGLVALLAIAAPVGAQGDCWLDVQQEDEFSFAIRGEGFEPREEVTFRYGLAQNVPWTIEKTADRHGSFWEGLYFESTTPTGVYELTADAVSCSAEATIQWPLPDTAIESVDVVPDSLPWHLLIVAAASLVTFVAVFRSRLSDTPSER